MRSDRHWPVAIIGGGFSGTMAAAQLARKGVASVLVEGGGRAGLGAAYSTTDRAHLLNVPAGNMSAWDDVPDDFVRRVGDPGMFAERRQFGAYLRSILDETVGSGCTTIIAGQATGAKRSAGRWSVAVDKGTITADALVLATGNQPPGRLESLAGAGERLIANPWGPAARTAIARAAESSAPVLIVGTGLTMVDVVLSLDEAGHRGEILAVSRRGLIPRGHAVCDPSPVELDEVPRGSTGKLLSWLRQRGAEVGWRAAVDSLRPHSQALWRSLGVEQRRRFLRHARPWWDVHRHRIAPEVARLLVDLIAAGRLQVAAGRIESSRRIDNGAVEVTIRKRSHSRSATSQFAFVFNCTGPLHEIGATNDPLLKSLLEGSYARPDDLGIGLAVDDRSRVEGSDRLWAIGPLTKSAFWEIIAVPDIRTQAAAVADDISRELA